ncbi:MAG TPA: TonB family protein [Opitutaceae bacterium]
MRANSPDAWILSAVFHAAVVGMVVALTWWLNRAPEINPMVFELVEFSGETVAPAGESTAPAPAVKFAPPKTAPVQRPKIEPQKPPPPKPPPSKQPPPKQATTPAKTPPKTEPKTTITYEEFAKQQAKTLERNANPAPRTTKVPRIDTKAITSELQQYARAGVKDGSMSAAQATALDAYIARLITALRMAHVKPDGLSELLKAKVSFYVAQDGTLSAVRIITSSGDADFDRSVLDAFRAVRSIGSVPGGKAYTWELTFRMTEE